LALVASLPKQALDFETKGRRRPDGDRPRHSHHLTPTSR
jgi:hypothetical protein